MNLSPQVLEFISLHGIRKEDFLGMVKKSAIATHAKGNRRYYDYIFLVEGEEVVSVSTLGLFNVDKKTFDKPNTSRHNTPTPQDTFLVYEECPKCLGKGCAFCEKGEVKMVRKNRKKFNDYGV